MEVATPGGARRASVGVLMSPTADGYGTDDEKKTNRRASLQGPNVRPRRQSGDRTARHKQRKSNALRSSSRGIDPNIVARLSFAASGSASSGSCSSSSIDGKVYGKGISQRRRNSGSVRSRRMSNDHTKFTKKHSRIDSDSEGTYGVDAGVENQVPDAFGYESDVMGCESDMEKSTSSKMARRRNSAQTIDRAISYIEKNGPMLGDYNREDAVERPLHHGLLPPKENSSDDPESPFRMSPLTTSYAAPTEQALRDIGRIQLDLSAPKPQQQKQQESKDAWGMLELNDDFSGPKSSSNQSYGKSLYNNQTSSEEIDKYKQKARRRDSLVNCIDMDLEAMKKQVPSFSPAEGCYNASDFVVRCFTARLRTTGFTVLKHNRSRWSKSTHRVLYLKPDGITLSWRPTEEELEKNKGTGSKTKHPNIDLRSCREVRHAWTKDPTRENKRGTSVLRSRLSENHLAAKSLSLIFKSRTLDLTAFSNDQCKVMMEGFSALCFRLQLREAEDSSHTYSKPPNEDDWASTVYAPTTISTISTGFEHRPGGGEVVHTPWGL